MNLFISAYSENDPYVRSASIADSINPLSEATSGNNETGIFEAQNGRNSQSRSKNNKNNNKKTRSLTETSIVEGDEEEGGEYTKDDIDDIKGGDDAVVGKGAGGIEDYSQYQKEHGIDTNWISLEERPSGRRRSTITGRVALSGFQDSRDKYVFKINLNVLIKYWFYHMLWPFITPLQVYYEGWNTTAATLLVGANFSALLFTYIPNACYWTLIFLTSYNYTSYPDAAPVLTSAAISILLSVVGIRAVRDAVVAIKYSCYTQDDFAQMREGGNDAMQFLRDRLLMFWFNPSLDCVSHETRLAAFRNAIPVDKEEFYYRYGRDREAALKNMLYPEDIKDKLFELGDELQMRNGKVSGLLVAYSAFLQATASNIRKFPSPRVVSFVLTAILCALPFILDLIRGDISKMWGSATNIYTGKSSGGEIPLANVILLPFLWVLMYGSCQNAVFGYIGVALHDYRRRAVMMKFYTALIAPRRSKYPRETDQQWNGHPAHRVPEVQEIPSVLEQNNHNLINWLRGRYLAQSIGEGFHNRVQVVCGSALIVNLSFIAYLTAELIAYDGDSQIVSDESLGLPGLLFANMFFIFYILASCVHYGDIANEQSYYCILSLKRTLLVQGTENTEISDPLTQSCTNNVVSWLNEQAEFFPIKIFGLRADATLFKTVATLAASSIGVITRLLTG